MKTYCIIQNSTSIANFDTKKEAIDYAKKNKSDKVLLVKYNLKTKDYKELDELGCETIWEKGGKL